MDKEKIVDYSRIKQKRNRLIKKKPKKKKKK